MDWPLPPLIILFFNDAGIRGGSRLCSETLLLSPLCFHCCQEGSVIKLPFLSLPLCPTVLVSSYRGGGGFTVCTRAIVLHEVTGRSDPKINEETALLPQTLFLPARILWEESGYHGPQKGGSLTWQIEGWGRRTGGEGERCRWGEMWDVQVFFKTVLSRILSSSLKQPPPKPSFVATCAHHKNGGPGSLPNFSGSDSTRVDVQRAGAL